MTESLSARLARCQPGFFVFILVFPGNRRLFLTHFNERENMDRDKFRAVLGLIEYYYPDYYAYTDFTSDLISAGLYPTLIFRNREESFDMTNVIAVLVCNEIP